MVLGNYSAVIVMNKLRNLFDTQKYRKELNTSTLKFEEMKEKYISTLEELNDLQRYIDFLKIQKNKDNKAIRELKKQLAEFHRMVK